MAKGKKTGGRDFVKGQVANPKGRTPIPEELKKIRKMNRDRLELVVSKYLNMNLIELNQVVKDPNTTALDHMICQIIIKSMATGDHARFNALMDRVVGKVKDQIELAANPHSELMAIIKSRSSQNDKP
jgi:regulator of sigma D